MTHAGSPETYLNHDVVGSDGNKIGSVGQVYVNDETGAPDWITVNTGLFGMRENFIPLQGSRLDGDDLVVPFTKDVVKDAPHIDDASHLEVSEQKSLYDYYQQYLGTGTTSGGTAGYAGTTTDDTTVATTGTTDNAYATGTDAGFATTSDTDYTADADADFARTSGAGSNAEFATGHDTSGPTTDDAMTRSEEQLRVGTEQVEAGRARLRKYVVTEQQTVTVPVTHEEVRIEREPITEANRGDAYEGPAISEEEHEVVLHAERPVVTTEAVAVERVRLGTETVTEDQQVTGEVRKEEIEVEDGSVAGSVADGSSYDDRQGR